MTEAEEKAADERAAEEREYERHVRDQKERDRGHKLAEEITNALNVMSGNKPFEEAFVERLTCRTHPTLQQGTAQFFLKVFAGWAEKGDENRYDLRNKDTIEAARLIREALKDHYFSFV